MNVVDSPVVVVANRGEIAVRVLRASRDEGLRAVLLAEAGDEVTRARRIADDVVTLERGVSSIYLDAPRLVAAAREVSSGRVLLHPGYGYLSEDPALPRACAEAGVEFVGPSPEALALLGHKGATRELADAVGAPTLRGTGVDPDAEQVCGLIAEVSGPVVLKAASGGGGRAIRVVREAAGVDEALAAVRREAERLGGSVEVFAEEYLEHARHIEVQVARDRHGTAVTLGDRDCSLQRRHQKVVEFAPAVLEDAVREGMHASAVAVVDRAELVGLATVEYLWAPGSGRWTLLEVNPRLQVEHTITEEVTGADLVRGQIRLALGEDVAVAGLVAEPVPGRRSLQCRVTAEDVTATGWAPATGIVSDLVLPSGGGTRVDTHLTAGTEVTGDYDPLLAKIVVTTDGDPAGLLSRARAALAETSISGLPTTLPILRAILASVRLDGDDYDTGLLDRSLADLVELAKEHGDPSDTRPGADVDADRGDTARLVEQGWLVSRTGGTVTAVEVDEGQDVEAGGLLVLVEAMKMEQPITATAPGRIVELAVAVGDTLRAGDPVVRLEHDGDHDGDAGEGQDIDPADVRPDLAALLERRATTRDDARPSAVEKRRARGRTARENVADLCRGGDLVEYGTLAIAAQRRRRDHGDLVAKTPGDGMVAGLARLLGDEFADDSPEVAVIAYDYTVLAGTQGQINHAKTDRVLELAERRGYPVVIFAEGGGGRPGDTDGNVVTGLTVPTFATMGRLSQKVPSIGIAHGRCFAGNAALFGACEIRIATADANIGMGGPAMIEGGGLGVHTPEEIGPAPEQARNGVVQLLVDDEEAAVEAARRMLSFFSVRRLEPGEAADQRLLRQVVPENRKRVYDVRRAIDVLVDAGSFLELSAEYAPGMVTGLARLDGHAVAVVANDPAHLGGAIDADEARCLQDFLGLVARHEFPLVVLCDTPGFMVGPETERAGTVRLFSALFGAGAAVRTPIVLVVLRKAYGLGAQAMAGGSLRTPDLVLCWPTAELGPMGLEGAVRLGFRRELDEQPDQESRDALERRLIEQAHEQAEAVNAAEVFEVDDVIDPADTRQHIVQIISSPGSRRDQ